MFTRKKSLYKRKEFYIAIVAVLGLGYLISGLFSAPDDTPENEDISTSVHQAVDEGGTVSQKISRVLVAAQSQSFAGTGREDSDFSDLDNSVQDLQTGEYYLVKESGGLIKIYHYDEEGNESLLRTTDILFSLLGEEDQDLFSAGVMVEDEDGLLDLLQDFES